MLDHRDGRGMHHQPLENQTVSESTGLNFSGNDAPCPLSTSISTSLWSLEFESHHMKPRLHSRIVFNSPLVSYGVARRRTELEVELEEGNRVVYFGFAIGQTITWNFNVELYHNFVKPLLASGSFQNWSMSACRECELWTWLFDVEQSARPFVQKLPPAGEFKSLIITPLRGVLLAYRAAPSREERKASLNDEGWTIGSSQSRGDIIEVTGCGACRDPLCTCSKNTTWFGKSTKPMLDLKICLLRFRNNNMRLLSRRELEQFCIGYRLSAIVSWRGSNKDLCDLRLLYVLVAVVDDESRTACAACIK
ncbi:hypothetical protein Tco_0456020 [Tanacetum coccineum]